jgi:hypothetical protein
MKKWLDDLDPEKRKGRNAVTAKGNKRRASNWTAEQRSAYNTRKAEKRRAIRKRNGQPIRVPTYTPRGPKGPAPPNLTEAKQSKKEEEAEEYLKSRGVNMSKWPKKLPTHASEKALHSYMLLNNKAARLERARKPALKEKSANLP